MKRVVFVALMLALAVSASVRPSAARTPAQTGAELLNALPDGNAVVLIDVQRVTSSALWNMLASQEKFRSAFDKIQSSLAEVGLTLNDVQTVAVSFSNSDANNPAVAVSGRLNQSALVARLRADEKVKVTSETYKGFEVFRVESAKPQAGKRNDAGGFAFLDGATAVAGTPASVRAAIDVKTGSRTSIAQNAKLTEALATTSGAVRFALEMSAIAGKLPTTSVGDFSSIKMIFGSVDVTTGIDLNATLRNDTAEHARALATQLSGLLEMARGFLGASKDAKMAPIAEALKSVTITGNEQDVRITGNLPMEVLAQLFR
ncbi:MAG TPA: hypothetical protein VKA60_22915 [Blastocatellia bacterium]|nr:hypothetical protein [Blastocatellia bacterium]